MIIIKLNWLRSLRKLNFNFMTIEKNFELYQMILRNSTLRIHTTKSRLLYAYTLCMVSTISLFLNISC